MTVFTAGHKYFHSVLLPAHFDTPLTRLRTLDQIDSDCFRAVFGYLLIVAPLGISIVTVA